MHIYVSYKTQEIFANIFKDMPSKENNCDLGIAWTENHYSQRVHLVLALRDL